MPGRSSPFRICTSRGSAKASCPPAVHIRRSCNRWGCNNLCMWSVVGGDGGGKHSRIRACEEKRGWERHRNPSGSGRPRAKASCPTATRLRRSCNCQGARNLCVQPFCGRERHRGSAKASSPPVVNIRRSCSRQGARDSLPGALVSTCTLVPLPLSVFSILPIPDPAVVITFLSSHHKPLHRVCKDIMPTCGQTQKVV